MEQINRIFLEQLDNEQNKETYVRILALSTTDLVQEEIIGRVTTGSVNLDGSSAIRRTCSISMVALETDQIVTDKYWSYNNKFKLEIGLKNNINPAYNDIIWFDMGIYIITSFSCSRSTTAISISLQGKDKMCRLNGEVSGNLPCSVDFGTIEETTTTVNGTSLTSITKIPIYEIIHNAVREYGQERSENIIINDLEINGYDLWEYNGNNPLYLLLYGEGEGKKVIGMIFDGNTKVNYEGQTIALDKLEKEGFIFYLINTLVPEPNTFASSITYGGKRCHIAKISYGETAGYHQIPLVYGGDLILNQGETVTSLLDKIKTMLGNFEYFYDTKGRFVFQKKKTYTQDLFSPVNGELVEPTIYTTPYSYQFENKNLFTSISSSPNINNIKNDFSVWGTRKGLSGTDMPIHVRYAIDKKPTKYTTLPWYYKPGATYTDADGDEQIASDKTIREESTIYVTEGHEEQNAKVVDWRELIYRMALDYYRHNQESDFLINLSQYNSQYPNGKTGYEQYYIDMQGYWRELYNPKFTDQDKKIAQQLKLTYYGEDEQNKYWCENVRLHPTALNFWIDFFDTDGELGEYSVKKIGVRSKVVNDSQIKSIFYKDIPEVLFVISPEESMEDIQDISGFGNTFTPIQIQENLKPMFYRSDQGVSAIAKVNDLFYQHAVIAEGISITSLPIYYLQPNTRIYVKDFGDFTLDRISYSLAHNGTMSLSGNKIFKQFS